MPYCRPDELRRLWGDTGLHEVKTSAITVEAGYSGFDDLWRPLESGVAPSGAYAAALPSERRARLREEFRRRLNVGNGPFRLAARAWCVVGRVPCSLSNLLDGTPRTRANRQGEVVIYDCRHGTPHVAPPGLSPVARRRSVPSSPLSGGHLVARSAQPCPAPKSGHLPMPALPV
jgi:hypothetical protein